MTVDVDTVYTLSLNSQKNLCGTMHFIIVKQQALWLEMASSLEPWIFKTKKLKH